MTNVSGPWPTPFSRYPKNGDEKGLVLEGVLAREKGLELC
jgi:hypothetical protein